VAIFDLFDEWFKSRNFAGCPFIKTLLEFGADHPVGRASIHHLDNIRGIVRELAAQARLAEPGSFAHSWHMLMTGSVIAAAQGDLDAAQRAKATAEALLAQYPRAGAA
jgi:hypothetical protein